MHQPILKDKPARIAAFHQVFTEVAAELGGFNYVPEPPRSDESEPYWVAGHLFSQAETATVRVSLNLSTYAPTFRAEASGVYPQTSKGSQYRPDNAPRIGFLVTKPAKQIAGDIRRRFLAEYKAVHAKALDYVQKWEKAEQEHAQNLEQLQAAGFDFTNSSSDGYCRTPYAKCRIYSSSVDLDLKNLSVDKVAQIINYLKSAA